MNKLIAVGAGLALFAGLSMYGQNASPGTMTQPTFIPVPGSQGVQQPKSAPVPEDHNGNPPTVTQLQEIHKNDTPTSGRTYRDKRAAPAQQQQASPLPRKSDMPREKPMP